MAKTKLLAPDSSETERFAATLRTVHRLATNRQRYAGNLDNIVASEPALLASDRSRFRNEDPRRWGVYQRLSEATLKRTLELELPHTCKVLGPQLLPWIHRFREEGLCSSALLRDLAFAFAVWACPHWRTSERLPRFLPDLARYELFEFAVLSAQASPPPTMPSDVLPELPLQMHGSVRLARFDFAVHRWSPILDGNGKNPVEVATWLLGYRDAEGDFAYFELNAMAFAIVSGCLLDQVGLYESVTMACADAHRTIDEDVVNGIAKVLESLANAGVFFGSQSDAERAYQPPLRPWQPWLLMGKN